MSNNTSNSIDGQLQAQLQKLAEEIALLQVRLEKATKAKEINKLKKLLEEKMALYKSLTEAAAEEAPEAAPEEAPKAPEAAPESNPEAPKAEEAPKAPKAPKEALKAPEAPKAPKPKDTQKAEAPKVSAKDIIPNLPGNGAQEKHNDSDPPKWASILVWAVLAIVLGAVAWWYSYKDTTTVANAVIYEQATEQLKSDIEPAWYRWHSWDLAVKGEAIIRWMPIYKAVFVDGGHTSSKGEALLYSVGCAIRALNKKGLSVGEAALRVDAMSGPQLKKVLDEDTTLTASEVRAIRRALGS